LCSFHLLPPAGLPGDWSHLTARTRPRTNRYRPGERGGVRLVGPGCQEAPGRRGPGFGRLPRGDGRGGGEIVRTPERLPDRSRRPRSRSRRRRRSSNEKRRRPWLPGEPSPRHVGARGYQPDGPRRACRLEGGGRRRRLTGPGPVWGGRLGDGDAVLEGPVSNHRGRPPVPAPDVAHELGQIPARAGRNRPRQVGLAEQIGKEPVLRQQASGVVHSPTLTFFKPPPPVQPPRAATSPPWSTFVASLRGMAATSRPDGRHARRRPSRDLTSGDPTSDGLTGTNVRTQCRHPAPTCVPSTRSGGRADWPAIPGR